MSRKPMIEIGKETLRTTVADITQPRKDIAARLGVSSETLKKWLATGFVPPQAWDSLKELRKEALTAKIAEIQELVASATGSASSNVIKPGEDLFEAAQRLSEEKQGLKPAIPPKPPSLPSLLVNFTTEDLLNELNRRGYCFIAKKVTTGSTTKKKP